jgi:hypothetical protein
VSQTLETVDDAHPISNFLRGSDLTALARLSKSLATINLTNNYIGDNGCRLFCTALNANSAISCLVLKGNRVSDVGAAALATVVSESHSLAELNLRCNKVGLLGAQALGGGLRTNTSLTRLDLGENYFGDRGAAEVAHSLRFNASLLDLVLRANEIGNAGAVALAVDLRANTTLQRLDLVDNDITSRGASSLASALFANTSLRELDLRLNELPLKAQEALSGAAEHTFFRRAISSELVLAIALALHPRLGADSLVWKLVLPGTNAYKQVPSPLAPFTPPLHQSSNFSMQAVEDHHNGVKKTTRNDLRKLAEAVLAAQQAQPLAVPPLEDAPLSRDSLFRKVLSICINKYPRDVYFDGIDPNVALGHPPAEIDSRPGSRLAHGDVSVRQDRKSHAQIAARVSMGATDWASLEPLAKPIRRSAV